MGVLDWLLGKKPKARSFESKREDERRIERRVHPMVEGVFMVLEESLEGDDLRACHSALDGAGRPSDLEGRQLVKAFAVAVRYCFPLYTGSRKNRQVLNEAVALINSYAEEKEVSDHKVSDAGETAEAAYLEGKAASAAAFEKWRSLNDAGDTVRAGKIGLDKLAQSNRAALSVAQAMAALGYVLGIDAAWACRDKEAVERLFLVAGQNAAEAVGLHPRQVPALIANLVSVCHEPTG